MRKYTFWVAISLGISMLMTVCGSKGNVVTVELSDSALTPNTLTVPLGAQITFTLKNNGTTEYDCSFRDMSTIKTLPSQFYWGLNQVPAGATRSGTFHAPAQPASFQIACGASPFDPVTGGISKAVLGTLVVK